MQERDDVTNTAFYIYLGTRWYLRVLLAIDQLIGADHFLLENETQSCTFLMKLGN